MIVSRGLDVQNCPVPKKEKKKSQQFTTLFIQLRIALIIEELGLRERFRRQFNLPPSVHSGYKSTYPLPSTVVIEWGRVDLYNDFVSGRFSE